ncbi:hypothetical protein FACS189418_4850 [Clostridia bacterium]|nr:hypothetical protein FACS189418_4850 [Clostridia bacterium]
MGKYTGKDRIEPDCLYCNSCGKKIVVEQGVAKEGTISISCVWDYFSEKDGERHHFTLCEECYDRIISQFVIPVEVEEGSLYI